jgi:hypothetical protein
MPSQAIDATPDGDGDLDGDFKEACEELLAGKAIISSGGATRRELTGAPQ